MRLAESANRSFRGWAICALLVFVWAPCQFARAQTLRLTSRPTSKPASRPAAHAAPGAPNVVIFLIDTLRADRIGAYGYDRPASPTIDALAKDGVLFEQAYSVAPWTLPSVCSLFTSTFPCEHATLTKHNALPPSFATLAEQLELAGYETYSIFTNSFLSPKFGTTQGFENVVAGMRIDGSAVAKFMGDSPPRPFFLYVHNLEPHNPYLHAAPHTDGFRDVGPRVREEMAAAYRAYKAALEGDFRAKRQIGSTDNAAEVERQLAALDSMREDYVELYGAAVRAADARVASVVELLKQRGWWDDTLFIVLADHGDQFGEHGGWLHDISVYESLLRVPLVVHFPKSAHAGTRVKAPVTLLDLLPTIVKLAGATPPSEIGGQDLLPLIRDPSRLPSPDQIQVVGMRDNAIHYYKKWKELRGDVNVALRRGDWKAIWNAEPDTVELYDLAADPHELSDLCQQQPELAKAFREHARRWLEDCRARSHGATGTQELDAETLRNLRALGYAQ